MLQLGQASFSLYITSLSSLTISAIAMPSAFFNAICTLSAILDWELSLTTILSTTTDMSCFFVFVSSISSSSRL